MRTLRELFAKKEIVPLRCEAWAVVDLIRNCLDIGAPGLELTFRYGNTEHRVGIESDFSEESGFFDTELFLDAQRFSSLSAFITGAQIDGETFVDIREIAILRDRDIGDPRAEPLLAKREIKRQTFFSKEEVKNEKYILCGRAQ